MKDLLQDRGRVFYLSPTKVKVSEDLPRYRRDAPKIKELLESIQRMGQIAPIVVTKDHTLVAGGRRLAACLLGDIPILCIYQDNASPLVLREIELEENIQRESYTPADEADAIADLHEIKRQLYGEAQSGREGGWRLDDTAESIGKTRGTVIENIQISEALKMFPELRVLKTKKAIKSAAKAAEKVVTQAIQAKKWQEVVNNSETTFIENIDARIHMPKQKDSSVDILLTDPKFGIDIDKTASGIGGETGGFTTAGYKFDDSKEDALELLALLAKESFRFCTNKAHAYIFTAPEFFSLARELFIQVGWKAYIKPIIWIKRSVGQVNNPSMWPASCYEMILYCRKEEARLVTEGMPDWIQCDPVLPSAKRHPTEKPVDLLVNLLKRVAMPAQHLYDPFMGSGSSIEAGIRQSLVCHGCDIDINAYNSAIERLGSCDFSVRGNFNDACERAEARSRNVN